MSDGPPYPPVEPQWHKLLALSAHELRKPLSPITGYLRMLASFGPLTDQQQKLIREIEKLYLNFPKLADELDRLAEFEEGTAKFNRGTLELGKVVSDAITSLPDAAAIRLEPQPVSIVGDAYSLRNAFTAILIAVLRQLAVPELVVRMQAGDKGAGSTRIGMAAPAALDELMGAELASLVPFNEWEGGMGLAVPISRRVLNAHGAALLAPPGVKTAAVVVLRS
jgi:signal transduction histidine kinase